MVINNYQEEKKGEIIENCYETAKKFSTQNMVKELHDCFIEIINED